MLGVLAALNGLSRNRSLDRLIRGRTWIVLIAFALIGIVTLQLLVLRLNANIGRSLVREEQLQRENAALSIESSELAAGERVESQAARLGMELVPEGSLRFLPIDPHSDIGRAAAALSTPVHTSAASSEASGPQASGSAGEASAGSSGEDASAMDASATDTPSAEAGAPSTAQPAASATGETSASSSEPSSGASTGSSPPSSTAGEPAPEESAGASTAGAAEAAPPAATAVTGGHELNGAG